MIVTFLRRHGFVVVAGVFWLVLVIFQVSTGAKQPHGNGSPADPLSALFSVPSSWFTPAREALLRASAQLPGVGGQLLPGLAIGDTSRVSDELTTAMKTSSLTHLVAVSGANCQIVTATCFFLLTWAGAPRWVRIFGAALGLLAFVALVTPGASISRAAVMSLAVLVGMASGRLVAGLPALAASIVLLLLINPLWATNYGFVLSVLATAGLLTLSRPLTAILERWMPTWLATVLAIPIAASVFCQPVIILLSPQLPTYGVLANLLAVPAAGIVTILGLVVCLSGLIWLPLATLLAWIAWLPAEWIGRVAQALAAAPFAKIAWPPGWIGMLLAFLLSALFVYAVVSQRKRRRVLSLAGIALGLGASLLWTIGSELHSVVGMPSSWKIAACDVGQGDAFLIRAQDAQTRWHVALIDTGRSPELMRNCLVRMGVSRLDLVLLTHYDLDHVGGAQAVAGKADRVIVGPPDNQMDQALATQICIGAQSCDIGNLGMTGSLGEAQWKILWPNGRTPGMQTGNPGSVTLLVQWPHLSGLFTGDLGAAAQDAMLADNQDIPVIDVLKVAHHGSSDTSEHLIKRISPRVALISVGADNGYGHPTGKALGMLERNGAAIGRTDRQGMLFVTETEGVIELSLDR